MLQSDAYEKTLSFLSYEDRRFIKRVDAGNDNYMWRPMCPMQAGFMERMEHRDALLKRAYVLQDAADRAA